MKADADRDPPARERPSRWQRLAEWTAANPWRLIFLWLAVFAAAVPMAIILQGHLSPSTTVAGTESARVEQLVADRFGKDPRNGAVLVAAGLRPAHEPADREILKTTVEAVRDLPQILSASSIIDLPRGLMVGADGTGALIVTKIKPGADARKLAAALHRISDSMADLPGAGGRDLRLYWTGNFFIHADVVEASGRGARQGEVMALPLTMLLLLAVFGSVRAALSPVLSAVVAVASSMGLVGLMTVLLPWSPSVLLQNVISLIGLGLAIDYSLLTVNQFRAASERGLSPGDAIIAANAASAPTIVLAGFSVFLGFAALLLVPIADIRSIGIGGILASIFAVLVSTTLLPAVLGLLAPRLARGRAPAGGRRARRYFAAVAQLVCRRPRVFLLASAVPLVLLGLPTQNLKITAHSESWLSADSESTRGLQALIDIGRRGLANEILVVAEVPAGDSFLSAPGWAMAHEIYRRLVVLDHVDTVIALPRSMSAKLSPETLQGIPRRTLDPLLSPDNRTMLFRIFPDSKLDYVGLEALVQRIRALRQDIEANPAAPEIWVGGIPASTVDYVQIVWSWMPLVIGLVILGAFVVLGVAFRSPVVALKAVLLNLFSVTAAFGLATLVFLDGHGAALIGVHGPIDGVFPAMPLIVFCAVFSVSMDYEVFLISRIATARRAEPGETSAIVRGISETGMVITFAAAIMILVFGSFAATDFLPAKMLGFTLATAVFFDATIVRILMSPALMRLAGRWNWWPGM